MSIADEIAKIAGGGDGRSTHQATVLRTDPDGTTWVSIAGGADETPVHSTTAEVQPGDTVSVTIANGRATIVGNATSPASTVRSMGVVRQTAETAQLTANDAAEAAASAIEDATLARAAATSAQASAQDAETAATAATTAAGNAQVAANAATFALSDVEKVVGTLEWIAEHGEYQLTTDTAVVAGKVYYTRSGTSPNYTYTVVAEPKTADIATYYELHMDESVQNFIASHLWLDSYGLNLSVDGANGYRIHQGTVDGTKPMGTYVLDTTGTVVASFGADGAQIGAASEGHVSIDKGGMDVVLATGSKAFSVRGSVTTQQTDYEQTTSMLQFVYDETEAFWVATLPAPLSSADAGDASFTWYSAQEPISHWGLSNFVVEDYDGYGDWTLSSPDYPTYEMHVIAEGYDGNGNITSLAIDWGNDETLFPDGDPWVTVNGTFARYSYVTTVNPHMEQGVGCSATGDAASAMGNQCTASGQSSHAEGEGTTASGHRSHAEGYGTTAGGMQAHAEGSLTDAGGPMAHAGGWGTVASGRAQTVVGMYNEESAAIPASESHRPTNDFGKYAVIVGNGTSDSARSNALAVDWLGNVDAAGGAAFGGTIDATGAATTHGSVFTVTDAIDIDGANPSAVQYSRWFECDDKDGDRIAVFGGARETDGRTRGFFYAYNKTSGGSLVNNHMNFYVDKSGNCSYGLSDPDAFCEALHVGDRVTKDQSTAVSMTSGTWTNICSVSLPAGTWVIEATGQFASNATGRRYIALSESSAAASATVQRQTGANANAVNGGVTYLHTGATKVYTSTTTLYLVGNQNSGAALNVYGCITAVRIK